MFPCPPRPCTSGIRAGQSRRDCGRTGFRLSFCRSSLLSSSISVPDCNPLHVPPLGEENGAVLQRKGVKPAPCVNVFIGVDPTGQGFIPPSHIFLLCIFFHP